MAASPPVLVKRETEGRITHHGVPYRVSSTRCLWLTTAIKQIETPTFRIQSRWVVVDQRETREQSKAEYKSILWEGKVPR